MSAHSKTCNVNVILKKAKIRKKTKLPDTRESKQDLILVMCFYNNLVAFDKYDINQYILTK